MDSAPSSRSASPVEERQILESWTPEPLVPEIDSRKHHNLLNPHIVSSKPGRFITINGIECLNLGTHNYLGLADHPRLEEASIKAVEKYGVGSCGPRAFYGTMDVHLKLEEELANFLNLQEAVLYSFGFSTIASAIPAYAKSSDVVFVDEACNFSIQQGIAAAKSRIIKFEHNNVSHLKRLLEEFDEEERKLYGKTNKTRTFLIVEGIYAKTGQLCPLKELIELKKEHKIRLFIDESRSFGVLGADGRGITQHFIVDVNDVDLIMASLENAACAFGGFCAGSTFVVDHQRLAGSGYCFSASLPPLQTQVALESLKILREDPGLIRNAQEMFTYAHNVLKKLTRLRNISHPSSPIKLLVINRPIKSQSNSSFEEDEKLLSDLCATLLAEEQIAVSSSKYLLEEEMTCPEASLRMIISGCLIREDIDRVFRALERFSARLLFPID